ncbi:MAG TPA: metallophosphoesterase [Anaeromyxobacter sp.]|nr:metallophosphoesterase [Anaeromyxobacter sp.]
MPGASPRIARLAAALALPATACVHDVHRLGDVGAAPPAPPAEVRVLVLGDFGRDTLVQWLVARAIRAESRARPFDLAVQLGDNVYYCGPDPTLPGAEGCRFAADGATVAPGYAPPDDPLFRMNEAPLERLRARGGGQLPIYLALGNHDIGWGGRRCSVAGIADDEAARRRACLEVARRSPAWSMPGRHYVVDRGPLRLVVVDTNVVVGDYGGFTLEDEVAFVRAATEGCGPGRFCFLVGHHPPAAVHGYGRGGPSPYAARMARLVAAAGGRAVAFLAGHVHTLEHLSLGPLDVFVSGSTAMGALGRFRWRVPASARAHFATTAWGFAVLEADGAGWRVRFQDHRGEALHCCEAARDGPCAPVECR